MRVFPTAVQIYDMHINYIDNIYRHEGLGLFPVCSRQHTCFLAGNGAACMIHCSHGDLLLRVYLAHHDTGGMG